MLNKGDIRKIESDQESRDFITKRKHGPLKFIRSRITGESDLLNKEYACNFRCQLMQIVLMYGGETGITYRKMLNY